MSVYDLSDVKLPVMTGATLKLVAGLLSNPVSRSLLTGRLLKDGGVTAFRDVQVDDAPVAFPVGPISHEHPPMGAGELEETVQAGASLPVHGIRDFAAAYREGKLSPNDVADRVLEAIDDSQTGERPLRAMLRWDADDVRKQAAESTDRLANGNARSLLEGVPVAIKDELDMVPFPTTLGTRFLGKEPASEDATLVARLRAAGALLIGKANMHEIGINPNGFNQHYGTARNPYNRGHDTGGSSSGSACAVAAGLSPLAIGADGGGSIRIPAALCGVVGLKATFGRMSEHGVPPLCWSVAHVGPIGAGVADVAYGYLLTAGADAHDPHSLHQPEPDMAGFGDGVAGLRIGIFSEWFEHADPEVVRVCSELVGKLESDGAKRVDIEIPGLNDMRVAHAIQILSEMSTAMQPYAAHHREMAPSVRLTMALGQVLTSRDYVLAERVRAHAMKTFARIYEDVDVILTPATATPAPPLREECVDDGWSDLSTVSKIMRFIIPGNLCGHPALSFPAGYTKAGLPIGMQAMGRHWEESLLFRVAAHAEKLVERQRPATYYDLLAS